MKKLFIAWFVLTVSQSLLFGQSTAFKYQGSLTDGGNAANGSFQMQFKLFDAVSAGGQIGSTLTDLPVTATNGVFSVSLDFGTSALNGANRWIEIAVRRNSGESYVTLSPRERISPAPYAVRTLSAATADTALDSQKLGGINADQYVTNATVGSSFIKNDTVQQTANFNISGNGRVGGNFGIGTTTPNSGLELRGTGAATQQRITDSTSGNSLVLQGGAGGNMKVTGYNYGTGTAQALYLSTDGANTFINPQGGLVGVGSTNVPTHALDVWGFFRAAHVAGGNVVSETFGGTNSWAKLWARTPTQSWSIGSSNNFNGNELYFSNENLGGGIRMAIKPDGNVTQNIPAFGLPKAMLLILDNGTISRCYNGITGVSTGTCGFTSTRLQLGIYSINLGFPTADRIIIGSFGTVTPATSLYVYPSATNNVTIEAKAGTTWFDTKSYVVVY